MLYDAISAILLYRVTSTILLYDAISAILLRPESYSTDLLFISCHRLRARLNSKPTNLVTD